MKRANMKASIQQGNRPSERRGAGYVVVLGCAMMVTVIGLSAVLAVRLQLRIASADADVLTARFYARSAVDMGRLAIRANPDWRTYYGNGEWVTGEPVGDGTYSVEVSDPGDADVEDSEEDPILLTGTGYAGQARHAMRVELVPVIEPLTCLEVSLLAADDVSVSGDVTGNQILAANSDFSAWFGRVRTDVEAATSISGFYYYGDTTHGVEQREIPTAEDLAFYYDTGTRISIYSLPTADGFRQIGETLISPGYNPFGSTDPSGIYIIDCNYQKIRIRETRIVGTIGLINPGSGSIIEREMNWEAAVENYPVLLVYGDLTISMANEVLSESEENTNFNPASTPYNGVSDNDWSDKYPCVISGLIYVSGDLSFSNYPHIEGVVIAGDDVSIADDLDIDYLDTYLANPPPGFRKVTSMEPTPGSWRQVVD